MTAYVGGPETVPTGFACLICLKCGSVTANTPSPDSLLIGGCALGTTFMRKTSLENTAFNHCSTQAGAKLHLETSELLQNLVS